MAHSKKSKIVNTSVLITQSNNELFDPHFMYSPSSLTENPTFDEIELPWEKYEKLYRTSISKKMSNFNILTYNSCKIQQNEESK